MTKDMRVEEYGWGIHIYDKLGSGYIGGLSEDEAEHVRDQLNEVLEDG